jgi:hypothetical protein
VTPLPERRKTAEELAELRENLGVPDELPPGAPGALAAGRARTELPGARVLKSTPALEARMADPREGDGEARSAQAPETGAAAGPEAGAPAGPKPVRSLRKSERRPPKDARPKQTPRTDSRLPARRHADGELQRIRMQNAIEAKPPVERIAAQAAHPMLLILGYALAIAGGVGGLLAALFLFLKKPRSSHHAAWMTIIGVLVLVFGILYLLPKTDGP